MKIRPSEEKLNKTPLGLWATAQTPRTTNRAALRLAKETGLPFPIVKAHLHLAGFGVEGDKW